MTRRWPLRQVALWGVLVGATIGYGAWVASTVPFTTGSDVAVACGLAAMAGVAGRALWRRARGRYHPPDTSSTRLVHWLPAGVVLIGFEVGTYLGGQSDRRGVPTISSLYDSAASSHPAKAALVVAWLALGWMLFRR